ARGLVDLDVLRLLALVARAGPRGLARALLDEDRLDVVLEADRVRDLELHVVARDRDDRVLRLERAAGAGHLLHDPPALLDPLAVLRPVEDGRRDGHVSRHVHGGRLTAGVAAASRLSAAALLFLGLLVESVAATGEGRRDERSADTESEL